jgi:hypothetical protein
MNYRADQIKQSARDAAATGKPMQAPSDMSESQVQKWERAWLEQMVEQASEGG